MKEGEEGGRQVEDGGERGRAAWQLTWLVSSWTVPSLGRFDCFSGFPCAGGDNPTGVRGEGGTTHTTSP